MKERFKGRGRTLLLEALHKQELVGGNPAVAAAFAKVGTLVEFAPGETLTREGDGDDDMYFLVTGAVAIVVKGTEVAMRHAGCHVGEMSALESAQPRAATAVAQDATVALKISSPDLLTIGEAHPRIWRPMARDLARRLYQRNALMTAPNEHPKLFIISSLEALPIAREIASGLQHDVLPTVWTDGVFFASGYPLEVLEDAVERSDFAVAATEFEDIVESRGTKHASLRDNVVFELGLFMGRLGRRRTMLVQPRKPDVKLPSDLTGLTTIAYPPGKPEDLTARLGPACHEIRKVVQKFGVRTR